MLEADLVRAGLFPIMLIGAVVIWRRRRFVAGRLLILIGALHMSGLFVGRGPIARMVANGIIGQAESGVGHVPALVDQELVFWFALWGVWTMLLGEVMIMAERGGVRLPPSWGWQLLVVNLACGLLIPKAGFWWVVLPAWWIISGREPESSAPVRA